VRGLFVTATDTGVGKTVVTAALARALRARGIDAGVCKPVQSGNAAGDPDGDAMLLRSWSGVDDDVEEICPHAFAAPLAPLVAARLEGEALELEPLVQHVRRLAYRHDVVLVEGAGGLAVPVGEDWTIADLAAAIGYPLLIVARPGLGTVNHTALTATGARELGLQLAGVVLNGLRPETDASFETNAELIEAFARVRVVGVVPWIDEPEALLDAVAEHCALDTLFRTHLGKETAHV
jgi:dethiobiotin synthetase